MNNLVHDKLLRSAGLVLLLWCSAFLLLPGTYLGVVDLWSRSDTYAHGYVVLPISLYLIWRIRSQWQNIAPEPQPLALLLIGGCLAAWLLGVIAGVQALEHLAAVTLLPFFVWAVMGNAFTHTILFPLCFLIFAVPIGDFLIEPMMSFTADFTVATIRTLGIPVYREGLYFSLPSGNWSVVKACSGIRYIIASLTLGALFSYLNYSNYWKRAGFILFAAVVPIIANGIRAVLIVLIGHYSNMKLATGADHLVYGWVFFGAVIFFMFWVGSFFADDTNTETLQEAEPIVKSVLFRKQLVLAAVTVMLILGFHYWHEDIKSVPNLAELPAPALPQQFEQWQLDTTPLLEHWQPTYFNPAYRLHGGYRKGANHIGFYAAYFPYQNAKSELISSVNDLAGSDDQWRVMSSRLHELGGFEVKESVLRRAGREWLMWSWYQTATGGSANRVKAKLSELEGIITGQGSAGAAVVIYQPVEKDIQSARTVLTHFMQSLTPQIKNHSASRMFIDNSVLSEATH